MLKFRRFLCVCLFFAFTKGSFSENLKNEDAPAKFDKSLKAQAKCDPKYRDCLNYGECKLQSGSEDYLCQCRRGTSGSYCEFVDQCLLDRSFCGLRSDAHCVYDFSKGRASCSCDDPRKKFDFRMNQCRISCATVNDCNSANCINDSYTGIKFCQCHFGHTGDQCQLTVDECKEQGMDCQAAGAKCGLGLHKQAECFCKDRGTSFDSVTGQCRKCDCGKVFENCVFINGRKSCDCNKHYYEYDGSCQECKCDRKTSDGCKFENGHETCLCKKGLKANGLGCSKPCGQAQPCMNGGTCMNSYCTCMYGFSGEYCEKFDKCTALCGEGADTTCEYYQNAVRCNCGEKKAFNQAKKACETCDCGVDGSCSFDENGRKVCICNKGYLEVKGTCKKCNCGRMSLGCRYDENQKKKCVCKTGYSFQNGLCLP